MVRKVPSSSTTSITKKEFINNKNYENIKIIQINTSSKDIDTTATNFNGLEGVSIKKEGNLYKYYYGSTPDYEEAKKDLEIARKKYSSAYIVPFKDGNKISLKDAMR